MVVFLFLSLRNTDGTVIQKPNSRKLLILKDVKVSHRIQAALRAAFLRPTQPSFPLLGALLVRPVLLHLLELSVSFRTVVNVGGRTRG
jgi:hypothetical protein